MINQQGQASLRSKRILVTGVSRSMGIGAAITKMLAQVGAQVVSKGGFNRFPFSGGMDDGAI